MALISLTTEQRHNSKYGTDNVCEKLYVASKNIFVCFLNSLVSPMLYLSSLLLDGKLLIRFNTIKSSQEISFVSM